MCSCVRVCLSSCVSFLSNPLPQSPSPLSLSSPLLSFSLSFFLSLSLSHSHTCSLRCTSKTERPSHLTKKLSTRAARVPSSTEGSIVHLFLSSRFASSSARLCWQKIDMYSSYDCMMPFQPITDRGRWLCPALLHGAVRMNISSYCEKKRERGLRTNATCDAFEKVA